MSHPKQEFRTYEIRIEATQYAHAKITKTIRALEKTHHFMYPIEGTGFLSLMAVVVDSRIWDPEKLIKKDEKERWPDEKTG